MYSFAAESLCGSQYRLFLTLLPVIGAHPPNLASCLASVGKDVPNLDMPGLVDIHGRTSLFLREGVVDGMGKGQGGAVRMETRGRETVINVQSK